MYKQQILALVFFISYNFRSLALLYFDAIYSGHLIVVMLFFHWWFAVPHGEKSKHTIYSDHFAPGIPMTVIQTRVGRGSYCLDVYLVIEIDQVIIQIEHFRHTKLEIHPFRIRTMSDNKSQDYVCFSRKSLHYLIAHLRSICLI